jgi:hypothetical protein
MTQFKLAVVFLALIAISFEIKDRCPNLSLTVFILAMLAGLIGLIDALCDFFSAYFGVEDDDGY